MKAVILAAGMGRRLQNVLEGKPKPLFEIKGRALLEYSLNALAKAGIKETIIVIGHKGNILKEKIGNEFNKMEINYATNDLYKSTGSMHSLYSSLKKPKECLVLDGDLVYDPLIIKELINHKEKDAVFLASLSDSGDEVYVVLDNDKRVIYLGKEHPGKDVLFEFTGISKFSKKFIGKMFELHEKNLNEKIFEEYYEDCALRTSMLIPWKGWVREDLPWSEVDKVEDVPRAEKVLAKIQNKIIL